ncbi:hypothetical protein AB4Y30_11275 [Ornithinibacillus sp. 4-3]|uniref:Uncharacterized protein n=1 Tax=Ornithinibacillus sp. 4-3 TaxID=3231488 RepID=A0AB39HHC3_9BACI
MYFVWPIFPQALSMTEKLFWLTWIGLFLLVVGANLASLLQIVSQPIIEQKQVRNPYSNNN